MQIRVLGCCFFLEVQRVLHMFCIIVTMTVQLWCDLISALP